MSFNTVYSDLQCPFCQEKVQSGVGFRWGVIANIKYQPGDRILWRGGLTRPSEQPNVAVVKTVGYFNCDNVRCSTWQDCYPSVQRALVTIEDDQIKDVAVFDGEASDDGFDIIEPKDLILVGSVSLSRNDDMSGIQPREFLAIPGPTPVPDAVLEAVARHPIGHRTADFSKIFEETLAGLQWLGETQNDVFILTSSGTGAMEAAISNVVNPGDQVISLVCGVFSERWAKIAEAFGAQVERIVVPPGKPYSVEQLKEKLAADRQKAIKAVTITHNETSTGVINDLQAIAALVKAHGAISIVDAVTSFGACPLPIDEWGIDVLVCGSQKALMLPPGLGIIFFGERAWQANASCKTHRFYYDLKKYKKSAAEKTTPFTPNVSLVAGLHTALSLMKEEGTGAIFARHTRMRDALRSELSAMGLKLFVDGEAASPTITAIYPPGDLTVDSIRKSMRERFKILTADGQEELKGKIFRIGHMGYVFDRDVHMVVAALRSVLTDLGHKQAAMIAAAKTAVR